VNERAKEFMNWLVFALSGPVLWAISTHLDKYLVERYFKDTDVAVLVVFTALVGLLLMPVIALFEPAVFARDAISIALMMLSGILYMGAILFYLQALQGHDASVVAPFFQASPLFGYGLAYVVLGETLTGTQIFGGLLILAGVLSVSVRSGRRRERIRWQLAAPMLACGFVLSLSTLIFKVFAVRHEFWATTFWMFAGEAVFGAGFLCLPRYRAQFIRLLRSNTVALLAINGSNELINLGGGLGNRYALIFAPLSIVQAIGSTTTLFVFAFGIGLTLLFPRVSRESLSWRELATKGIAAILVAAGVALVTR
jgi:drug/metabolite transporter (DMT)-like permease